MTEWWSTGGEMVLAGADAKVVLDWHCESGNVLYGMFTTPGANSTSLGLDS